MSVTQVDKIVELYRALAKFPSPTSVRILNRNNNQSTFPVVSSWTQRNLECGKLAKFQLFHQVDLCSRKSVNTMPTDASNVLLSCASLSEEFNAVLREVPSESTNGSKKQQFLEIWRASHLWKNFDLTAFDIHGDVYCDVDFSSFEWSSNDKLLYIAERKCPKTEPFYKPKSQEKKDDSPGDSKIVKGNEYLFRQDWGEQLLGKSESVIGICDIKSDLISTLDGIPDRFCPGQVIWTPDGNGFVGVVWNTVPRRLGLVYCSNRESYIFHLTVSGDFTLLSDDGKAVRSPRFSPNGEKLVWLERETGGPHHAAHRLVCFSWNTKEKQVIIDIVNQELKIKGDESFYGLYNLSLPKRCWAKDSNEVVLSTPQKYTVNSYLVNLDSKCLSRLKCDEGSLTVLDVWDDVVVCSKSSFNKPPVLLFGKLEDLRSGKNAAVRWLPISELPDVSLLNNISYHYLTVVHKNIQNTSCNSFPAMYIGPETEARSGEIPLIVFPHGGPHSANSNIFLMHIALFNLLGFGVLLINYRGSIGAGDDNVNFLPGHIGATDVQDVRLATKVVLEKYPVLNSNKVLLYGGSHGGFLVTHLSGQYPADYKAVVAVNPVIDVAAMFSISDIPDWSCVETHLPYNITGNIPFEAFEKMKECSPINFCSSASPPTLLLIGKKDARVPGSQGINFYHSLKANNVKTKLLLYDDNHSLSQVPVEIDSLINSVLWFHEHL